MLFDRHYVKTDGKSTEQILDLIFKEREIRAAKEREDRAEAARKLAENKAEITAKKPAAPEKRVDHFAGFKKFLRKMHL